MSSLKGTPVIFNIQIYGGRDQIKTNKKTAPQKLYWLARYSYLFNLLSQRYDVNGGRNVFLLIFLYNTAIIEGVRSRKVIKVD